ncbi:MAG: hypothetical protein ACOCWR_08150 [Oceanidesulfovibrio sp.]
MDLLAFEKVKAFQGYMPRKLAAMRSDKDIQRLVDMGLVTRGCWGQCDRMRGVKISDRGRRIVQTWMEDATPAKSGARR